VTVAVVQSIIDPVLGAGTAVKSVALAKALAAAGVRTRLIATDIGLAARPLPPMTGVEVRTIPARLVRFSIPQIGSRAMANLVKGCDAVILMNHWTALNGMAYRAARRHHVPHMLCPSGALKIQGRSRLLKRLYQVIVGKRLIADAIAVIATTELEASQLRADNVPADRIRIIPNGIDPHPRGLSGDEFRSRHSLPGGPLLLYMGRFTTIKGPDLLLEAFAQVADRFPEWRLVLAGRDEGLEHDLRRRATTLAISARVHFVGHLDLSESTGAYRAASLLVVPSRHEAMSLVALEAAAVGTPVLLTDACGFDEIERAGGGRVVPPTVAGLAQGLTAMLADPGSLPLMGARLRDFAVAHYGWPTVVQQYLALAGHPRPDSADAS
jgi:glycosyltransferase involved in cell wall biosynthesis